MFRLANPQCDLRIAAGRELHLGSLQPLGLYAATSIFVGDYLTTRGQSPEDDYRMIEELGFVVESGEWGVQSGEQSGCEPDRLANLAGILRGARCPRSAS